MHKEQEKVAEGIVSAAAELAARAANVAAVLIIEVRTDGGWLATRVNCPTPVELGLAELALENAKARFLEDRAAGLKGK